MGTRIPIPPFSTPSIDDLVARDAQKTEDANAPRPEERVVRSAARRVPIRRRERASPARPALLIAVVVGLFALALLSRRTG